MFKTDGTTIKVTRGDHGTIDFFIPLKDKEGNLKYLDNDSNVYWYDLKEKKLYDSSYEISTVDIKTLTLQLHTFNVDDVIRFKVFKRKDCHFVEIQKDIVVTEPKTNIDIILSKEDTKIGGLINNPVDYWYEVELNPNTEPQTVICFDDDGEKIFKLFPEGADKE